MSAPSEGPSLTALIAAPVAALLALIGGAVFIAIAFGGTAVGCGAEPTGTVKGVPAKLVPIYQGASAKYQLGAKGPAILAAINFIETAFGANLGPSSAGAEGWMQFMPETWTAYGVDGDGDGDKDTNDPWDAIHAAANYLRASGAPEDWRTAIFAYNHADWYVADVLAAAQRFQGVGPGAVAVEGGCSSDAFGAIDWGNTSGPWGGSQKFAELAVRLARREGCSVVSAKRSTESTLSGGVSDHWAGARHSYAVDLGECDLTFPGGAADHTARAVAVAFGLSGHTGVVSAYRGRYRIQLLWQTYVGGDHYDHVHVGIRNLCCPTG